MFGCSNQPSSITPINLGKAKDFKSLKFGYKASPSLVSAITRNIGNLHLPVVNKDDIKKKYRKTHRAQTHQNPNRLITKVLPHHYYQQVLKPISQNNIKFNNQKCSLMLKACTIRTKSQEKMIEQPKEKAHGRPKLRVSSFKSITTNKLSNNLHTIRL